MYSPEITCPFLIASSTEMDNKGHRIPVTSCSTCLFKWHDLSVQGRILASRYLH